MSVAVNFASEMIRNDVGILVLSADLNLRRTLLATLESSDWVLHEASSGADALEKMEAGDQEVLLLDPVLPDLNLAEFKMIVQTRFPHVQTLTINPQTGQPFAMSPTPSPMTAKLVNMLERLGRFSAVATSIASNEQETADEGLLLPGVVGNSEVMRRVCSITHMVARHETTVLITGSSGTGKEIVARAIHKLSPRRANPFVVINCAAIPESLLEAELFGFVKGSFTGAVQSRIGRIQAAHGGTLFLDEIGDMPIGLQSKMLRFLENGELQRIGASDVFRVDVRILAATNANLRELMLTQRFREDLYYRLAVFPIDLPPLKDRIDDLPSLVKTFLYQVRPHRPISISASALMMLQQHDWPGKVRELRNIIERACILVGDGREITSEHILV